MTTRFGGLLRWSARVLGGMLSVFFALFALDAFGHSDGWFKALAAVAIHLLPAFVVLGFVLVAWRREWAGGIAFIGAAVLYALATGVDRLDWILVISGPLTAVGVLFLWSWRHHAESSEH
jgi:chromate transport protein ChrA